MQHEMHAGDVHCNMQSEIWQCPDSVGTRFPRAMLGHSHFMTGVILGVFNFLIILFTFKETLEPSGWTLVN